MKLKIVPILILSTVINGCIPHKDITYLDNTNNRNCMIEINYNTNLNLDYLYNTKMAIEYRIASWSNVLLNSVMIQGKGTKWPIIIKKYTVNLYDSKGNSISFKRIDWFKSGGFSDENILHFKTESEFLNKKYNNYPGNIIYIFNELNDDKLRMDYHFIFEIKGKNYEIKDSKELHRKTKWIFITPFDI